MSRGFTAHSRFVRLWIVLALAVIGVLVPARSPAVLAAATWTSTGTMSADRFHHTATLLSDGRVLVAGGSNALNTTLASAEIYDPATNHWTATTNTMPQARQDQTATLLNSGDVLIVGGYNGTSGALDSALLFVSSTAKFGTITSSTLSVPRVDHTATLLNNGDVLIVGGHNSTGYLSTAELYDPTTHTFSSAGDTGVPRAYHTATLLSDGRVLIAGGYNGTSYLNSAQIYDPSSNTWSTVTHMNSARSYFTATLLNDGTVLAAGGKNGNGAISSAEVYDPASDTWTNTSGSMTTTREYHSAALLSNGKVLIAGGEKNTTDKSSPLLSSAAIYNPATGQFSSTVSMKYAREYHTATVLTDGRVLIAAGTSAGPYAEVFSGYTTVSTAVSGVSGSGAYGGTATLTATLTTGSTPISNATVSFTLNGSAVGSATTASNGVATLSGVSLAGVNPGVYSSAVGASFAGDSAHDPSTGSGSLSVSAPGTWSGTGSMSSNRTDFTATLLNDGRVLVVGGAGGGSSAELYDAANGTWTSAASMHDTRNGGFTATLLNDGRVLVAGGENGTGYLTSAEIYDPDTGQWSSAASMPIARAYHTATLLQDGSVLVAGGIGPLVVAGTSTIGATDAAEVYDPVANTWTALPHMTTARYYHTASLLNNGKVMITGGFDGSNVLYDTEVFNPFVDPSTTDPWTVAAGLPSARAFHTATLLTTGPNKGDVLVTGGTYSLKYSGSTILASSYLFVPGSGWVSAAGMPSARENHTATVMSDGRVLVAGGDNHTSNLSSAVIYDPTTGKWASTASMSTARTHFAATLLTNGAVLASGGGTDSAELFSDYDLTAASLSATSMSSVAGSGPYSGTATLTATLTSGGTAVSGASVGFTLNGHDVGSATTNGSGIATLSGVSLDGIDVGAYPDAVGASFAGNSSDDSSSATGDLQVNKADQTIDFTAPDGVAYGDPDSGLGATATSGLDVSYTGSTPGVCTITSDQLLHVVSPGSCTITASQGGNSNYNSAPSVTQTFAIAKADQTISFGALASKTYGDADFTVSATASSGLTVSFSTSGNCTNSGSTIDITGAGSCTVTASQGGNAYYNAAASVSQSSNIAKADQTIIFGVIADQPYGAADLTLSATGGASGNPVTFAVSGNCTLGSDGVTLHLGDVGSCSVTASQAGSANYNAAPDVTQTFNITKANQTITFGALADKTYGDADFTVSATASSGLPVSFSAGSTDQCTVTQNSQTQAWSVHITGAGSCTITASQGGNSNYNAAAPVPQTFSIAKAAQTISFGALANKSYGDADFTVSATASSGLTVSFSTSGNCTNSGSTIHITGAGSCTVTASQGGNANYKAAPDVQQSFNIAKADQSITFPQIADRTYGDPDVDPGATASSGLTVGYGASGNCSVVSGKVHITGAGSCTVTASQPGDSNYNAAQNVTQTFNINKANQTISFSALSNKTYGDPDFDPGATASSGLTVSYAASGNCSIVSGEVHITGAGSCTVAASQGGNPNYNAAAPVSQTFSIAKANQTITFAAISNHTYGDADFDPGATASSGLAVSYSASGNCSIVSGKVRITGGGSCTVTASQAGDTNYNAAPSVSQTFSIALAGTTTSVSLSAKSPNPTAQFSDTVTVMATVSANTTATGNGVFSGTLSFQINGKPSPALTALVSNTSPTQSVGIRLDNTVIPNGAGGYAVTATFTPAAGGNYAGSSASPSQTVQREGQKADGTSDGSTGLTYNGDQYVTVGSAPNLLATLSQSLAPEAGDTEYVDYSKVNVYAVFNIYPAGCGTSCTATPTWTSSNIKVADRSDWSTSGAGYAQVSGPKTLSEGSYLVTASLVANGYIVAEAASGTLDVASSTGTFITGGGFVSKDSTSNASNPKGNFGLNIKSANNSLQGNAIYIYRMRMDTSASTTTSIVGCTTLGGSCHDVDIIMRSNKLNALNVGTTTAYPMTGYATGQMAVQFVDAVDGTTHYTQFEIGGGTFRLDLKDNGSGGSTDTYGFTAYRKDGTVFHQAYIPATGALTQSGTGSPTNQVTLGGGNTSVHPK